MAETTGVWGEITSHAGPRPARAGGGWGEGAGRGLVVGLAAFVAGYVFAVGLGGGLVEQTEGVSPASTSEAAESGAWGPPGRTVATTRRPSSADAAERWWLDCTSSLPHSADARERVAAGCW